MKKKYSSITPSKHRGILISNNKAIRLFFPTVSSMEMSLNLLETYNLFWEGDKRKLLLE